MPESILGNSDHGSDSTEHNSLAASDNTQNISVLGDADLPTDATERNPLAPSDNAHNRLFKCLECGKRFPSHARLARHLYVCHRALIEGMETKAQVAMGTRTIPVSQTASQVCSFIIIKGEQSLHTRFAIFLKDFI